MNFIKTSFLLLCVSLVVACSSTPKHSDTYHSSSSKGESIAQIAKSMIGVDYLYGGSNPDEGFDCSGLVFYSHNKVGSPVDRTAYAQYLSAQQISRSDLSVGDLLFYNINGKPSHVAIYIGDNQFVHAPSSGKKVSISSMDNPYFKNKLVKIGRLYNK